MLLEVVKTWPELVLAATSFGGTFVGFTISEQANPVDTLLVPVPIVGGGKATDSLAT